MATEPVRGWRGLVLESAVPGRHRVYVDRIHQDGGGRICWTTHFKDGHLKPYKVGLYAPSEEFFQFHDAMAEAVGALGAALSEWYEEHQKQEALMWLKERTQGRLARGVEGKTEK